MFKDIAVFMTGRDADCHALDASVKLARQFDAKLLPLHMVELHGSAFNSWGIWPDPKIEATHTQLRHRAAMRAERTTADLKAMHIDHHPARVVEALYTQAWKAATRECHCADLVVTSKCLDKDQNDHPRQNITGLLFQAGRPILVMPSKSYSSVPPKKVLVAWQPVREAARAIHDAIPLLLTEESVDIVTYDGGVGENDSLGRQMMLDHLWRHGVHAKCVALDSHWIDVASLILSHADSIGAELVVAGGYGHSRFAEWILGGVTRGLLTEAHIPIFLSH